MKKGWKQTWRNLLFQHFEIQDITKFEKYLPKNCKFDSFEGKYYIGLVSMQMTDVSHKSIENFILFKKYNELNVRTYITLDNKPGVLFLSLDVDSFISVFGARVFYGLPYRLRKFDSNNQNINCFENNQKVFSCDYKIDSDFKTCEKDSFSFWATERYFFANKYLGFSFKGQISHKPWRLCNATVKNTNLKILDKYDIVSSYPDIIFCDKIEVDTSKLQMI